VSGTEPARSGATAWSFGVLRLQEGVLHELRDFQGHKPVGRVEVVLSALVHDADVSFPLGICPPGRTDEIMEE
jgi:hypothetical protein